jgi:hypothetical protein
MCFDVRLLLAHEPKLNSDAAAFCREPEDPWEIVRRIRATETRRAELIDDLQLETVAEGRAPDLVDPRIG